MNELDASQEVIAFILPPATALAGMRLSRWIPGEKFETQFGFGFRFAFGLGVGMVAFTQAVLLCTLIGINAPGLLAWGAILWGGVELVLRAMKFPQAWKLIKFQPAHLWLLLLLPLLYSWWVFGNLSTLEGTLEFDANAFWVFKSKIMYLEQGRDFLAVLHQPNLAYMHMDYPMLVPCLYTFTYGAVGGVDEFVNKVWPFWMMVTLSIGILSLAYTWRRPHPLPIAVVTLIGFLPATIQFIRNEGGTIPMVFAISMATLLAVKAMSEEDDAAPAAIPLAFAVCFCTKLEGVVFSGICSCALLPFFLRRRWFANAAFLRSAVAAIVCLLPYVFYRLTKPVVHPESLWMHDMASNPGAVLHRFPQTLFLNFFARFFGPQFFQWKDNADHLQWTGQWTGPECLSNAELSVLPWLLLVLLLLSLVFNARGRLTLGLLSGVILVVLAFLSFVISSLSRMQADLAKVIDMTLNVSGRYYYPFFVAWFLGIVSLWFPNKSDLPLPPQLEEKRAGPPPKKPKRRQ